jgi:transposase
MVIHKNARLTLRSREELVQCVARSMTLKRAAASFKVTPKTVTKWVRRYRLEGPSGLCDRSSRPRRSPRQTSAERIAQVIHHRRQLLMGYRIAQAIGLSPATVSRILQRAALHRWRDLHPRPPVVRYEHPFPGDMLHLDIKGLTRYQQVSIRGDGRRRGRRQFAAGRLSMSPSMITPGSPFPSCCPISSPPPPSLSSRTPSLFMPNTAFVFAAC